MPHRVLRTSCVLTLNPHNYPEVKVFYRLRNRIGEFWAHWASGRVEMRSPHCVTPKSHARNLHALYHKDLPNLELVGRGAGDRSGPFAVAGPSDSAGLSPAAFLHMILVWYRCRHMRGERVAARLKFGGTRCEPLRCKSPRVDDVTLSFPSSWPCSLNYRQLCWSCTSDEALSRKCTPGGQGLCELCSRLCPHT